MAVGAIDTEQSLAPWMEQSKKAVLNKAPVASVQAGPDAAKIKASEHALTGHLRQGLVEARLAEARTGSCLHNVYSSHMNLATEVEQKLNYDSYLLDQNTFALQQLNELRSQLGFHSDKAELKYEDMPERMRDLLSVARKHRVQWPENEGWANEAEREARFRGLDMAMQSLSKVGERKSLLLQGAQAAFNGLVMTAANALSRLHKLIQNVVERIGRG